ncbi:DivIVA domain-containing protein [Microbacterium sp. NPDC058269]|jgi:DivIVA domain-containing protein|uniref:DivIVA domain-containing protein n=1 Tax=Microbacterium sp. NPDC058269 TaxID=3346414 RepID=UPI0036DAD58E
MNSAELAATKMPLRRTGSRFAVDEVDDVVAQCVAALQSWERGQRPALNPDDIVIRQFRRVQFAGEGYDADSVDDLLDEIVIQLRSYDPPPEAPAEGPPMPPTKDAVRALVTFRALTVLGVIGIVGGIVIIAMRLLGSA